MSYGVRKEFYHSKLWNQVRKNIWIKQNLLCAECNKPVYVDGLSEYIPKEKRRIGIVHHIQELNNQNITDENITIGEDNLVGLCIDCHNRIHSPEATRDDVTFDSDGNLISRQS